MDTGLLILRLALGLLLIGHGSQKLFGRFGGHGLDGTSGFFHSMGFRPGKPMAFVAGASELGAGLLLALGLLTPLASAAVVGTLFVASSVHWKAGLWAQNGGFELALVYSISAVVLGFTGPGAYSLDNAVGLDGFAGNGWGVLAAAIGVLFGFVVVSRARKALADDAAREASGRDIYPAETPASPRVDA
ncbi:MAG TPA: DoxX family protein [Frankiaceae bacterium]|nr:DoxX family protein [Frankiaceae bacterium]